MTASSLEIARIHALEYRATSPASKGGSGASTRALLRVHGSRDGRDLIGVGESALRGPDAPDPHGEAWAFLQAAIAGLPPRTLPADPSRGLDDIREMMRGLLLEADRHADDRDRAKPFRGLIAGVELALLDLLARACEVPLHRLLGTRRAADAAAPRRGPVLDGDVPRSALERAVKAQADRFPWLCVRTTGDPAGDLELLAACATIHVELGYAGSPLWLDVQGALDRTQSTMFIGEIAGRMAREDLPPSVIVQQPVPRRYGDHLPELQRMADERFRSAVVSGSGGLRIMADDSVWDLHDLTRLQRAGGCRAITVNPARAGGLLPSLQLVQQALAEDPDVFVHASTGAVPSDVAAWGLEHLLRALPQLDATDHGALSDLSIRIVHPAVDVHGAPDHARELDAPGLGVELRYLDALPHARRFAWAPEPESIASIAGAEPNLFDVRLYDRMSTQELDSHLIQREALAHGLDIERTSTLDFVGTDGHGGSLCFWWSMPSDTPWATRGLTANKQATRTLLQRRGVPVPEGRAFLPEDQDAAYAYAETLGYPVVLKPVEGSGGRGVFADLRGRADLQWAFEVMPEATGALGPFIVEKHVHGEDYRIFVLGDRVLSVAKRTPAAVVGDGSRTVMELVVEKNALRLQNPHLMTHPIRLDRIADRQLERQGLSLTSVPGRGQRVVLAAVANLARGGDSVGLLEEVHPSILRASADAVAAIPGLALAGVDFLISDHRLPVDEQDAGICEINCSPAQTANETTLYGYSAPISREMVTHFGARHGLQLRSEPLEEVSVLVRVTGRVQRVGYRRHVARLADRLELDGWVRNGEPRTVELCVSGQAGHVSTLLSLLVRPGRRAIPEVVRATHNDEPVSEGFEILP